MFSNVRKDMKQRLDGEKTSIRELLYLVFSLEVWATIVYRFGYWVHHRFRIPLVRSILKAVSFTAFKTIEIVAGISVPFSAEIGEGFYIGHFGGIIISPSAKIGKNCTLGTGVVIGTRGLGDKGVPVIGDNVFIGVGAKILGGIRVGNSVRIGANAVVIDDVPDNATVVGIPAKVVRVIN